MNWRAAVLVASIGLSGCVPWTVRPIERKEAETPRTPQAYVESIWSSKLLPALTAAAVDARELLSAKDARERYGRRTDNGPVYFIARGKGTVMRVDTGSRVGLALVDLVPGDGKPDVSIQIGPVLQGNALRDASGVVRFSDFVNQLQFADAGNEINRRVLREVLGRVDPARLKGRSVTFVGAVEAREPPLAGLAPVVLEVEP